MKASYLLLFVFFYSSFMLGQKIVEKTIINPNNQVIQVDTKNCYQVTLNTTKEKQLKVEATIEGEYQKDLVVKIEEDGENVLVSADFLPNFIAPNDKLSAHKVLSISLKIKIPEHCKVNVYGTNSKVLASGRYRRLNVSLANGNCTLQNIAETVEVKTQTGTIRLTTNEGIIDAKSNYGKVETSKIPEGNSSYKLFSVEGNIYVNKTE